MVVVFFLFLAEQLRVELSASAHGAIMRITPDRDGLVHIVFQPNSGEGEGLLFYGNIIIPFKDKFDKSLKLYSLMTTKPEEVEKRVEAEETEDKSDTKTWRPSEVHSRLEAETG